MTVYRWTVDAIEEGVAAVEQDGRLRHVPVSLFPADVKEGDIVDVRVEQMKDGAARTTITIDRAATEKARRRSEEQVARSARQPNDPGGDIVL